MIANKWGHRGPWKAHRGFMEGLKKAFRDKLEPIGILRYILRPIGAHEEDKKGSKVAFRGIFGPMMSNEGPK